MSNSLWFSMIFTLQSFRWFCFNYSYGLFLRCTWKKKTTRVRNCFITIGFENFINFNFSDSHLKKKNINFKITTNSFKYSLVKQFFETHFLKSNYRGVRRVYFLKNLVNFFGFIYPLTWGVEAYTIRATLDI